MKIRHCCYLVVLYVYMCGILKGHSQPLSGPSRPLPSLPLCSFSLLYLFWPPFWNLFCLRTSHSMGFALFFWKQKIKKTQQRPLLASKVFIFFVFFLHFHLFWGKKQNYHLISSFSSSSFPERKELRNSQWLGSTAMRVVFFPEYLISYI